MHPTQAEAAQTNSSTTLPEKRPRGFNVLALSKLDRKRLSTIHFTSSQRIFDDIQREMLQNHQAGRGFSASFSIWRRRWQTLAVLERKELITITGDTITLHPRRWQHGV
jgi:hypothetical protein